MDARSSEEEARTEAAVWQAIVLFSTLSTAADVWRAARERREGHDPSEQEEAAFVRPYLQHALGEVQALLMQLQARLIQAERVEEEGYVTHLIHRYNHLMALRRVLHYLKVIHQRLLSLYPAIAEALIEEARVLHDRSSTLLGVEEEVFDAEIGPFVHRILVFTGRLHEAI